MTKRVTEDNSDVGTTQTLSKKKKICMLTRLHLYIQKAAKTVNILTL